MSEKVEKLYLKEYKHNPKLSLDEFIKNFLLSYNYNYNTIHHNGNIQCPAGRNRSLGDIHAICLGYYPDVTRAQVKESLIENIGDDLVGCFCPDIHKRVYLHKKIKPKWEQGGLYRFDEYGDKIEYKNVKSKIHLI